MGKVREIQVGMELPPVTKEMTQARINLFEACGLHDRPSFHNDPATAERLIGLRTPIASGKMSLSFAAEALRRLFGPQVFDHSGTIALKFIRPVVDGDAITVRGRVIGKLHQASGTRVNLEVWCENQNGDKTAVGTASAVVS